METRLNRCDHPGCTELADCADIFWCAEGGNFCKKHRPPDPPAWEPKLTIQDRLKFYKEKKEEASDSATEP